MGGVNVAPDYVRTMGLGFSTFVNCSLQRRQFFKRFLYVDIRDPQKDMSRLSQNRPDKEVSSVYIILEPFLAAS